MFSHHLLIVWCKLSSTAVKNDQFQFPAPFASSFLIAIEVLHFAAELLQLLSIIWIHGPTVSRVFVFFSHFSLIKIQDEHYERECVPSNAFFAFVDWNRVPNRYDFDSNPSQSADYYTVCSITIECSQRSSRSKSQGITVHSLSFPYLVVFANVIPQQSFRLKT